MTKMSLDDIWMLKLLTQYPRLQAGTPHPHPHPLVHQAPSANAVHLHHHNVGGQQREALIKAAREMARGPTNKPVEENRPAMKLQRSSVTKQGGGDVEHSEQPMDCLKDLVSVAKAQVTQYMYSWYFPIF